jgi:hypothetical protein
MRAEIVFEIYFGIAKWHAALLERLIRATSQGCAGSVLECLRFP